MNQIELSVLAPNGVLKRKISANFDDQEVERLRQFTKLVERLSDASLLRRGMSRISKMNFTPETGFKFTSELPSNAELYELLHLLRPVTLHKESASFNRVLALLARRFEDEYIRDKMKRLRQIYDQGELSLYMQMSVGEHSLFDPKFLDVWLNGTQYHTDSNKAAIWARLENALSSENAMALVNTQLHSKVKALYELQNVVDLVLTKVDGLATP